MSFLHAVLDDLRAVFAHLKGEGHAQADTVGKVISTIEEIARDAAAEVKHDVETLGHEAVADAGPLVAEAEHDGAAVVEHAAQATADAAETTETAPTPTDPAPPIDTTETPAASQ